MSGRHSEPDAGVPARTARPGQANALGGDGADAAGRGARILIVEDEAWDAELAQRLLTSAAWASPPSWWKPGNRS